MLQIIVDYIAQKNNDITILAYIVLAILFISSFFTFKKFPLIETIGVLITVGFTCFSYFIKSKYNIVWFGINLSIWAIVEIVMMDFLLFIVKLVKLSKFKKQMRFYELTPSNIESNIYAYLNKKSEVLMYTNQFYEAIGRKTNNKNKKWYRSIQTLIVDGKEMTFKKFMKYIKDFGEKNFSIEIKFSELSTFKTELQKSMISEGNTIKGYILFNQRLTPMQVYKDGLVNEYKGHMYNFFNSMNESIAYLDNQTNEYILTDTMMAVLGTDEKRLSKDDLIRYVVESDLYSFNRSQNQSDGINNYFYRLKTVGGEQWFSESKSFDGMYVYSIIHVANFLPLPIKFLTTSDLENDIQQFITNKAEFTIVFMSLRKIQTYTEKYGKDVSNTLINIYFNKLSINNIYRLSYTDFCIILNGKLAYDGLINEIITNTSDLLHLDLSFNGIKYAMNNTLGIVKWDSLSTPSANGYISAAYESLSLASNVEYNKKFSIYKEVKDARNNFHFDNYKVDLDNEFLYGKKKI